MGVFAWRRRGFSQQEKVDRRSIGAARVLFHPSGWSFWPAALVATGGAAIWLCSSRTRRRILFLAAWIIPFWLVLEVTPTKLPHYAMVFYPAVAIGAAWVLREAVLSGELRQRTYKHGAALWSLIAVLQLGVLGFGLIYFRVMPSIWFWPLTVGVALFAALTVRAAWNGQFHAAITTAIITAALLYAAAFRFVLPSLDSLWMSRQTAEIVGALRACAPGPVVLTRYREPSAIFLLGTETQLGSVEEALGALGPPRPPMRWCPPRTGRCRVVRRHQGPSAWRQRLQHQGGKPCRCRSSPRNRPRRWPLALFRSVIAAAAEPRISQSAAIH